MKNDIRTYFDALKGTLSGIMATSQSGAPYQLDEAMEMSINMIFRQASRGGKLIFIGNGASASIASHMAVDFWKNAGIRALAFNDSSLLTCVSNDYGYERVFEKPIEMFAEPDDILIGVSSSGKSDNILRGMAAARNRKAAIITLSGFDENNPLRRMGDLNFYVPSKSYGHVETAHLSICHCLVDVIIGKKNGQVQDRQS